MFISYVCHIICVLC